MEAYLEDMDMTGLAYVWAMAKWRPKEYRRKVDAVWRCSAYAPMPDLITPNAIGFGWRYFDWQTASPRIPATTATSFKRRIA